ncbi:alpha/beta fold hydrolase [Belliella sp. DSM 111904]|uniref:Alpha/beta fold hydrolase n=1 Tax=Belliella filtrata TaxID=2923435 RepID=A0ABS9V4M0_9BACT|nr:alpha/beta fold hydrolase [Belliella filtrata]MCH7411328.1 alpha/beta fold hydrolase [Belliella filtrata]
MKKKVLLVLSLLVFNLSSLLASEMDTISLAFESEGHTLKGRLLLPHNRTGKVPVILFFVGSGGSSSYATDYKNFLQFFLKSPLESEPVAFLFFDKRGVGESGGKWQNTDFLQRAIDGKNAALHIKDHPDIDPEQIFVVGHSQGGWIVQLCLAEFPEVFAGGISMAGPTFDVRNQLVNDYQSGFICNKDMDPEVALKKAKKRVNRDLFIVSILPLQQEWKQLKVIKRFDPQPYIGKIERPLLLLFAENDRLVNPTWSLDHLDQLFPQGLPKNFSVHIAENENHSFKKSPLCFKGDWSELKFSENTKDVMADWIKLQLAYRTSL